MSALFPKIQMLKVPEEAIQRYGGKKNLIEALRTMQLNDELMRLSSRLWYSAPPEYKRAFLERSLKERGH
jgi:hypothetical protein